MNVYDRVEREVNRKLESNIRPASARLLDVVGDANDVVEAHTLVEQGKLKTYDSINYVLLYINEADLK